jgi:outer membrane protein assembly factor BamB
MIYALRAADGAVHWATNPHVILDSALLVCNNVVLVYGLDSMLYAFRQSDGSLLWRQRVSSGNAGEAVLALANGVLYLHSYDGRLYAVRANDGKLLWHPRVGVAVNPDFSIKGQPTYISIIARDKAVYGVAYIAPSAQRSCDVLCTVVLCARTSDGTLLWSSPVDAVARSLAVEE